MHSFLPSFLRRGRRRREVFLNWTTSDNPLSTPILPPTVPPSQGYCGSCWAFVSALSIQGALNRRWLERRRRLDGFGACRNAPVESCCGRWKISVQELIDCDFFDHGCDGGNLIMAMEYVKRYGLSKQDEEDPYSGLYGTCPASRPSSPGHPHVRLAEYSVLESLNDRAIDRALLQHGPVAIGFQADYALVEHREGIFAPNCGRCGAGEECVMNHALLLVGYGVERKANASASASSMDGGGGRVEDDREVPYWIAMNTWGDAWGENGFVRIRKGNGCRVTAQAVVAVDAYVECGQARWTDDRVQRFRTLTVMAMLFSVIFFLCKKKSRVDYGRKHTTSGKKSYFLTLRGARFGTKTPRRKKNKKLLCSQEETVYLLDTHWQKNYMGSS